MGSYLETYSGKFRFCYLVGGVSELRLVGKVIVGKWAGDGTELSGPSTKTRNLIRDFVNWPGDPEGVRGFTERYGPLHDTRAPGGSFRKDVDSWSGPQQHFQWLWKEAKKYPDWEIDKAWSGRLAYRKGVLVYTAPHLYSFLYLSLVSCPRELLRVCARPGCERPYFIARHPPQRYCSANCSAWAQRNSKLEWWNRVGKERLMEAKRLAKVDAHKRGQKKRGARGSKLREGK